MRSELCEFARRAAHRKGKTVARLTTKARKRLKKSDFAIPSKAPGPGSYPIEDRAHAARAKGRVTQYGSPSEKKQVRRAVAKKYPSLGKKRTPRKRKKK